MMTGERLNGSSLSHHPGYSEWLHQNIDHSHPIFAQPTSRSTTPRVGFLFALFSQLQHPVPVLLSLATPGTCTSGIVRLLWYTTRETSSLLPGRDSTHSSSLAMHSQSIVRCGFTTGLVVIPICLPARHSDEQSLATNRAVGSLEQF